MNFKEGEILYFDKPLTWTSFDLVGRIRNIITRATGEKIKVGHAGTLDPLATGIMILATGKATKQIDTLQSGVKEYIATLKLGATTPSFDMEHPEDAVYPTDHITKEMITNTLSHFKGEIMQVPPVYSAVKINGKRAFDRRDRDVELRYAVSRNPCDMLQRYIYQGFSSRYRLGSRFGCIPDRPKTNAYR